MTLFVDTYLVTDKLETYLESDVDAAEAQLGTRLPAGYREYVTTLGKGEYCRFLWMYNPLEIVRDRANRRTELEQYAHLWEDGFDILSEERLRECIVFGATIDADLTVFHPDAPDTVYELPRHDSTIYKIGQSLEEALAWYRRERLKINLGYFDSGLNQKGEPTPTNLCLSLDNFRDWLVALGGYTHLEERWNDNPGVSLDMYTALKMQMDMVAPELGEVMAFYNSFSGYVSASVDGIGRVDAQVVHDADQSNGTLTQIVDYLRSKAP